VQHQVRYLALLENVKVRRAGFAYRQLYEKFYMRYRVCSNRTWPNFHGNPRDATAFILEDSCIDPGQFNYGTSKIFIRQPEIVRSSLSLLLSLLANFM